MDNEWRIWQFADSAFPSSGFAHSGGLEAAYQHRIVIDGASLEQFLNSSRTQLIAGVLQFVCAAYDSPSQFGVIDEQCNLFLNNHVANRASRLQGKAFLSLAARIFDSSMLTSLVDMTRYGRASAHLAPVFGVVMRASDISRQRALNLFLFTTLRSYLSSAVRLGIVGPIEAQQIQAKLTAPSTFDDGSKAKAPVQTSPILDLLQATQNRLYSRLFQS
ncbi:MAG TPA: urease accessory UreF family protein [Tepidisphaeraceae bacterium]|nr:urease accessory UreF family protein [Tepidisphaeraceae bacterium]